jgi:hypothetical protein
MLKFIKNMRKKKYKIPENKNKIVINLEYYDINNPFHANIIENYDKMKKMERFKKICGK